jgi:hypothetical protein
MTSADNPEGKRDLRHLAVSVRTGHRRVPHLPNPDDVLLLEHLAGQRVDAIRTAAEAIIRDDLRSRIPLRGTNDNFDLLSDT